MTATATLDPPPLPGALAEIEEIAGRGAALALALELGGIELRVPRPATVTAGHALARVVGLETARAIAERFQGETVYVPMARRALVRHLTRQGTAVADIARLLGISRQTARRYRRGQ
ncbi:MAG: helix-turn-helix domain-containing protein [Defluviicoccus sp.]|nr:helix-turn-helix domain-containing protein [Defluviicoccus sp.]